MDLCAPLGTNVLEAPLAEMATRGWLRVDATVLAPSTAGRLYAGVPGAPSMTRRESEVLALLVRGRTNKEIGAALYLSPKTVSFHVHVTHLLQKLGVRSRIEAAAAAQHLRLVDPADGV